MNQAEVKRLYANKAKDRLLLALKQDSVKRYIFQSVCDFDMSAIPACIDTIKGNAGYPVGKTSLDYVIRATLRPLHKRTVICTNDKGEETRLSYTRCRLGGHSARVRYYDDGREIGAYHLQDEKEYMSRLQFAKNYRYGGVTDANNLVVDKMARFFTSQFDIVCELVPYLAEYSTIIKRIKQHTKQYSQDTDNTIYKCVITAGLDEAYHTSINSEAMKDVLTSEGIRVVDIRNIPEETLSPK